MDTYARKLILYGTHVKTFAKDFISRGQNPNS